MKHFLKLAVGTVGLLSASPIVTISNSYQATEGPVLNLEAISFKSSSATLTLNEKNRADIIAIKLLFDEIAKNAVQTIQTSKIIDEFRTNTSYSKEDLGFELEPADLKGVKVQYNVLLLNNGGSLKVEVILTKGHRLNSAKVDFVIEGFKTRHTQNQEDSKIAYEILNEFNDRTTSATTKAVWTISSRPTHKELGIVEPNDLKATTISYSLTSMNPLNGTAKVRVIANKGQINPVSKSITITGFLNENAAITQLNDLLTSKFDSEIEIDNAAFTPQQKTDLKAKLPEDYIRELVMNNSNEKELLKGLGLDYAKYAEVKTLHHQLGFRQIYFQTDANNEEGTIEINFVFTKDSATHSFEEYKVTITGFKIES